MREMERVYGHICMHKQADNLPELNTTPSWFLADLGSQKNMGNSNSNYRDFKTIPHETT